MVFLCYVDDEIWISLKDIEIYSEIRFLQSKGYKVEDKSYPNDYVDVSIVKTYDGQYVFTLSAREH